MAEVVVYWLDDSGFIHHLSDLWDNYFMRLIELGEKTAKRAIRYYRNILSPRPNMGPGYRRSPLPTKKDVFEITVPLSV